MINNTIRGKIEKEEALEANVSRAFYIYGRMSYNSKRLNHKVQDVYTKKHKDKKVD